MNARISIDNLIEIVRSGGKVKTGMDVYSENGILLLDKDIVLDKVKILEILKEKGIKSVPVNTALNGGLWDSSGKLIKVGTDGLVDIEPKNDESDDHSALPMPTQSYPDAAAGEIEARLKEIEEIRKLANIKYSAAKQSVKKVLTDIRNTGGEFDYDEVESSVSELVDFLSIADNPFSYLTQEIFSYDDYLYNHSVNVCAIGTAVANRFNTNFSKIIDNLISGYTADLEGMFDKKKAHQTPAYTCFYPEDLSDISLGFFLHDIGKTLVPDAILNKEGRLTPAEFVEVRKHSYDLGVEILERNKLKNSVIKNIVQYHHAPLYDTEERCYPTDKPHSMVPLYVRICKLADIYDAMTSKRSYKEAFNPINVVTQIFRTYAKKDRMLQYVLHAFVKSIGIYPPGSIVYLINGQMAYVLESDGPIVMPFTDEKATTLRHMPDPLKLDAPELDPAKRIDGSRSVKSPKDVNTLLPAYIKKILVNASVQQMEPDRIRSA